jgi:hypothetical protein
MLLIAHRGFSAGGDENTLAALTRAAADDRIGGVELDIRLSVDRRDVVLRHDPFTNAADPPPLGLDDALGFAKQQAWQVFLECKEYDEALYRRVCELVQGHAMADRVILFGFKDIARKFAWHAARPFRLGVIEEHPWRIAGTVGAFRPDVLLMGWMSTATRLAVQSWWSVFSLRRLAARMPATSLVMGVAQDQRDVEWFSRQDALFAATIDLKADPRGLDNSVLE